jgi:hypothetical protein
VLIEQLVSSFQLRVATVFDLHPRGRAWIGAVATIHPLADNAFEGVLAGHTEQISSASCGQDLKRWPLREISVQ